MPPAKQRLRRSPLLYVGLAIVVAIALTYRVRHTTDRLADVLRGHEIARLPLEADFPSFALSELAPEAEAAGLKRGDILVAIDGRRLHGLDGYFAPFINGRPGDRVSVDVRGEGPDGASRTAAIRLEPISTSRSVCRSIAGFPGRSGSSWPRSCFACSAPTS